MFSATKTLWSNRGVAAEMRLEPRGVAVERVAERTRRDAGAVQRAVLRQMRREDAVDEHEPRAASATAYGSIVAGLRAAAACAARWNDSRVSGARSVKRHSSSRVVGTAQRVRRARAPRARALVEPRVRARRQIARAGEQRIDEG